MPTNRLNLCVLLVAFGLSATAWAHPGDGLPDLPALADSEANGEESAVVPGADEAAAQAASCEVFGGFNELHGGRNRFRGCAAASAAWRATRCRFRRRCWSAATAARQPGTHQP